MTALPGAACNIPTAGDAWQIPVSYTHLGFADHQICNPFFADRFFMALGALLFHGHALVVVMDIPRVAGAALAAEVGSAIAAEQFGSK